MKGIVAILLATVALVAICRFAATKSNRQSAAETVANPAKPSLTVEPPAVKTPVELVSPISEQAAVAGRDAKSFGSPLAAELNAPDGSGARDVEVLHELLRQYLRRLHSRQGLPIGNDTDLLRALTGHNPMKLVVLPPDHSAVGADGRLRDRWGKPYLIHPRGDGAYEIRSAGPDRTMFTPDDLQANAPKSLGDAPDSERDDFPSELGR